MRELKIILLVLFALFLGIQFIRPDKNIASERSDMHLSAQVELPNKIEATLDAACYDCHSNTTRYPWYAELAPISWWIAEHVEHGKGHLNFSEYGNYSTDKKIHKLEEVIEYTENRKMPLPSYLTQHPEARMSQDEVKELTDWARSLKAELEKEVEKEKGEG